MYTTYILYSTILDKFYEDTNTHKTKLQLNADKESHLDIKQESKFVNSLVNYSADGGGNISLVAYPIARYVIEPNRANPAFDVLEPKIYRTNGGLDGLRIYP